MNVYKDAGFVDNTTIYKTALYTRQVVSNDILDNVPESFIIGQIKQKLIDQLKTETVEVYTNTNATLDFSQYFGFNPIIFELIIEQIRELGEIKALEILQFENTFKGK